MPNDSKALETRKTKDYTCVDLDFQMQITFQVINLKHLKKIFENSSFINKLLLNIISAKIYLAIIVIVVSYCKN